MPPSEVGSALASAWPEAPDAVSIVVADDGGDFGCEIRTGSVSWRFAPGRGILSVEDHSFGGDPISFFGEKAAWKPGKGLPEALVRIAQSTGMRNLATRVHGPGAYVCIRAGFVPDRGSWRILAPDMLLRIARLRHQDLLTPREFDAASLACASKEPVAVRILADMRRDVPCRRNGVRDGTAPLGRVLLVEGPHCWEALLDVRDETSVGLLRSARFGTPPVREAGWRPEFHPGPWGRYGRDPGTPLLDLGAGPAWNDAVAETRNRIQGGMRRAR